MPSNESSPGARMDPPRWSRVVSLSSGVRIDAAIVTHNTDFYLHNLLASIRGRLPAGRFGEVHVWDNASSDTTSELLRRFAKEVSWLRFHRSETNIHHGPALDALLRRHCEAEWVLLLDSDTEILRDFAPDLPPLGSIPPAFVGQIHPQMPGLYAYLAHLLIHRTTYLNLSPFRHHGAPGIAFFRCLEERRAPYVRFRWSDYVSHFGQATLREVYRRKERSNEFFRFAARVSRVSLPSPERQQREERMRVALREFLARGSRVGLDEPPDALRQDSMGLTESPPVGAPPEARERPLGFLARASRTRWERFRARALRLGLAQRAEEMGPLFLLVRDLRPRRVLEIGNAGSGSLYLWTRAAAPDATLVRLGLPLWELDDTGETDRAAQLRDLRRRGQRAHVLRSVPDQAETLEGVDRFFGGEPIDFLFWNGEPFFENARRDTRPYISRLRPGGLLALNHIHAHPGGSDGGVPALWEEMRSTRRTVEFIADSAQIGFGIGAAWQRTNSSPFWTRRISPTPS